MFNVTFQGFGNNQTVQAVPGDILLRVGESAGIKLQKDCEDGKCGSCVVKVVEEVAEPITYIMEEKEINTLIEMGALTPEKAEQLIQDTVSHGVRLACQYLVKGDITVKPYA